MVRDDALSAVASYGDTPMRPISDDLPDPQLLAALDQFTNALHWYQPRHPLHAGDALAEAIDDWIGEHANEHHHSRPFTDDDPDGAGDPLAAVLTQLLAAFDYLDAGPRPGLTTTIALAEALDSWAAEQAAEHHHSQPFQRPPAVR